MCPGVPLAMYDTYIPHIGGEKVQGSPLNRKFHIYWANTMGLKPYGMQKSQDGNLTPPENTDVERNNSATGISPVKLIFSFLNWI